PPRGTSPRRSPGRSTRATRRSPAPCASCRASRIRAPASTSPATPGRSGTSRSTEERRIPPRRPGGAEGCSALSRWQILDSVSPTPTTDAADPKARLGAERTGQAFVFWKAGDARQQLLLLGPDTERITVGRRGDQDIVLDWDKQVSRAHALLE